MNSTPRADLLMAVSFLALFGLACADEGIDAGSGKTCTYDGKTYTAGETFKSDCNTCTCMADGTAACTLMGCSGTGGWAARGGAGGAGGLC